MDGCIFPERLESYSERYFRLFLSKESGNRNFFHINAIEFARKKLSVTYLLRDNSDGEIAGYFTLAHKAIEIKNDNISNTVL